MPTRPLPGHYLIGSFTVKKGDDLMVTDPCYDQGDKQVHHVKPGKWLAYTRITEDTGGWGKRNASLVVLHESQEYPVSGIDRELGVVGVDSGQVGIYTMSGWSENNPSGDDYDKVCDTTLETPLGAGMVDYGATSSSGYGDGGYGLFGKTNKGGKIIALEVVFIPEDGDPRISEPDDAEGD